MDYYEIFSFDLYQILVPYQSIIIVTFKLEYLLIEYKSLIKSIIIFSMIFAVHNFLSGIS